MKPVAEVCAPAANSQAEGTDTAIGGVATVSRHSAVRLPYEGDANVYSAIVVTNGFTAA